MGFRVANDGIKHTHTYTRKDIGKQIRQNSRNDRSTRARSLGLINSFKSTVNMSTLFSLTSSFEWHKFRLNPTGRSKDTNE